MNLAFLRITGYVAICFLTADGGCKTNYQYRAKGQTHAQPLFFSLNLLFVDVLVAIDVVVCLSSVLYEYDDCKSKGRTTCFTAKLPNKEGKEGG